MSLSGRAKPVAHDPNKRTVELNSINNIINKPLKS